MAVWEPAMPLSHPLSRLPVEELGHTGFRHHTQLPFYLLLDWLLYCLSTIHAASRSDRHGGYADMTMAARPIHTNCLSWPRG